MDEYGRLPDTAADDAECIEGRVEEIVFRNAENGWTVLELRTGRSHVTVVGSLPFVEEGERVKAYGTWGEHPEYGRQFKARHYETLLPTTLAGIERYLASGLIKGVGPATARAIIGKFGKDALMVLELRPDRLTEVPGIALSRARLIADSFQERLGMQKTMLFLQSHGVSPAYAMRIWNAWGDRAQEVLEKNPYRLCSDIQGIGFIIADRIALALGIAIDAPARMSAGVQYALSEAAVQDGHTFLPRPLLEERACVLLGIDDYALSNTLDGMAIAGEVVLRMHTGDFRDLPACETMETAIVYSPRFYEAEGEVARRIATLCLAAPPTGVPRAAELVDAFEKREGITLATAQRDAVLMAARAGVTVITGGPGTGKTTIINCLLDLFEHAQCTTLLCAPTGRAAKRMTEATGREAKTLHRLLEAGGDAFGRDEDNPLEADVVIVDEMSMVDLMLMRALLRALPTGVRLVLVGDADQLPSVGAGDVLRDVIASRVPPVVRLTEVYRQSEVSQIVPAAHAINRGETPAFNVKQGDFFLERHAGAASAAQAVIDMCARRLPGFLGVDAMDIQVLCPMKKGELGTLALNLRLQEALNPPLPDKPEVRMGEKTFRRGDKVMQVKNNYQAEWSKDEGGPDEEHGMGIYNGDIGVVVSVDAEERLLSVAFDEGRIVVYDAAMVDDLEPAWAITIHKSQGSEFACAVIPVFSGPPMLMTRNLLYTAVTRARRLCVLVGREAAAQAMIANNRIDERYSLLGYRIGQLMAAGGFVSKA